MFGAGSVNAPVFARDSKSAGVAEEARDIDLDAVFADCFTASEIDLFSSQLQEYVGDGSLHDGIGNPITASPGSIPIAAGRTVNGMQQPAHKLPSSLGFSLSANHKPASIPSHGGPASGPDMGFPNTLKSLNSFSTSSTMNSVVPSTKIASLQTTVQAFWPGNNVAGDHNERDGIDQSGKPITEQQRIERRERNREHAKRSRIRKKFLLESLQEQVAALRDENMSLRQVVKERLPDKASAILDQCTTEFSSMLAPEPAIEMKHELVEYDFRLIQSLLSSQQCFAVSDPSLPDNPIVYVSGGFLKLTGYKMDDVLGRNCRFLQGPGTDARAVDVIRRGVAAGRDTSTCLLNYKADGTPFWNQFFVAPLRDADGNVVNFVGVQCEVTRGPEEEQPKRGRKRPVELLSSLTGKVFNPRKGR